MNFIYLIAVESTPLFSYSKVGISSNPRGRLSQIRSFDSSPSASLFLYFEAGADRKAAEEVERKMLEHMWRSVGSGFWVDGVSRAYPSYLAGKTWLMNPIPERFPIHFMDAAFIFMDAADDILGKPQMYNGCGEEVNATYNDWWNDEGQYD